MYKVHPKDKIPVRTTEEALALQETVVELSPETHLKLMKTWNTLGKHFTRAASVKAIVRTAHRFVDLAMQPMANIAVCAKGCSNCCKLDVDISKLEAHYIAQSTSFNISKSNKSRTKRTNDIYCPFHCPETAICLIWEYRPVSCRWFFTLDSPHYCEDALLSHAVSAQNGAPSTPMLMALRDYLIEASGGEVKDIRDYFS